MKVGDKININNEEWEAMHVTPQIKEDCQHEWVEDKEGQPEYCKKCGLSFIRYVFCCCP